MNKKEGTRIGNAIRRRGILMDYLKKEANGGHYWFGFSANAYALDRGEVPQTIQNDLKHLTSEGKIECKGQSKNGYLIRFPEEMVAENILVVSNGDPVRKCPQCGSFAPNADARFCWKCGASLLSDRELLKEAFDRVFPKIAKLSTDSAEMNEIMTVIGKVGKLAFEEVSA